MTDTATIEALLERLDERARNSPEHRRLLTQAASTIRALSAENERMRAMIETGAHKL